MRYLPLLLTIMMAPLLSHASTVSTFDVLLSTGYLVATGTTTVQGARFSVGGSTFVVKDGSVGIGTTTPVSQLHVLGPAISGSGAQLIWFSNKAALRAGEVNGALWQGTIGMHSVGFGWHADASAQYTTVSGGEQNSATDTGATVGGGSFNTAYGQRSVVNGYGNIAYGAQSAVLGGLNNTATGNYSTIGGGSSNIANGRYSMVPGGDWNTAEGDYSFAAGFRSSATYRGSFVWADYQPVPGIGEFSSGAENEFRVRAGGGFAFYSTTTLPTTIVANNSILISTSGLASTAVPNLYISSTSGRVGVGTKSPATTLDVNGAATASSATLTATGNDVYSLTSSSGIHILAGGITWPDGTTGVSSANEWQWVADTIAVNDTGVGFSNLVSSVAYRIEIDVIANTATSRLTLTFNGDNGSNYSYSYLSESDTNVQLNAGGTGQTSITLCADGSSVGGEYHGDVDFATAYSSPKKVLVKSTWTYLSLTAILNGHSGGRYVGSSNLSSAKISIGSGTIKGVVKLYRRNATAW